MPSTSTQPSNAPPPYFSGSDTEEGSSADEEYRQSLRAPGVDLTRVRSAQDEELPLPDGWIRQYDLASEHHFYVDTKADPPRSIWTHPFNDETFIKSIPDTERDIHTSSDLPSSSSASASAGGDRHSARDPRAYAPGGVQQQAQPAKKEEKSIGDKLKQRITGKTKEERAARRREKAAAERAEQERLEKAYAARRALLRQQMNDPRFAQRYAAPSYAYSRGPYYGGGYSRYGGYPGYNGVGMPLGYGGYGRRGMGMGMPLMGGLGGGLLLGSMMGGGFGGGYGGGFGGDCGGGGDGGGGGGD